METERQLLIVDNADVEFVRAVAAEHGVSVEELELRGIEPVLTTTLVILGVAAAVSTVATLVDRHRGGQVIDLRPGTPRPLYRSKDVIYGLVVIHTVDGRVIVEVKEPAGMFGQVLESLTGLAGELAGSSLTEVLPAVTGKAGEAASITAEPHDPA